MRQLHKQHMILSQQNFVLDLTFYYIIVFKESTHFPQKFWTFPQDSYCDYFP